VAKIGPSLSLGTPALPRRTSIDGVLGDFLGFGRWAIDICGGVYYKVSFCFLEEFFAG
jgi:hypothetical protein